MKKIKINLSRTSWILLSVGVFIVVLSILGVTYSSQMKKSNELQDELEVTQMLLDKYDIAELEQQKTVLVAKLDSSSSEYDSTKTKMSQSIKSIEVTDKCYLIASLSNVEIFEIGTTEVAETELGEVDCDTISINIKLRGELSNIINFIINLNDGFNTGHIKTIQIVVEEPPYAIIQIVAYSYRGE